MTCMTSRRSSARTARHGRSFPHPPEPHTERACGVSAVGFPHRGSLVKQASPESWVRIPAPTAAARPEHRAPDGWHFSMLSWNCYSSRLQAAWESGPRSHRLVGAFIPHSVHIYQASDEPWESSLLLPHLSPVCQPRRVPSNWLPAIGGDQMPAEEGTLPNTISAYPRAPFRASLVLAASTSWDLNSTWHKVGSESHIPTHLPAYLKP